MRFCQYKDIFGKPNRGFHKYQAIGDWILTIILALFLSGITSYILNKNSSKPVMPFLGIVFFWFVGLVVFAIFLHYLFCVKTRLNVSMGIN